MQAFKLLVALTLTLSTEQVLGGGLVGCNDLSVWGGWSAYCVREYSCKAYNGDLNNWVDQWHVDAYAWSFWDNNVIKQCGCYRPGGVSYNDIMSLVNAGGYRLVTDCNNNNKQLRMTCAVKNDIPTSHDGNVRGMMSNVCTNPFGYPGYYCVLATSNSLC